MCAANDNTDRYCPVCQSTVVGKVGKIFCSVECKSKAKKRTPRSQTNTNAPARTCKQCGCEFRRHPRDRDSAQFCSRECGFAYKKELARLSNPVKVVILKCKCMECGSSFTSTTGRSQSLCSEVCRKKKAARWSKEYAIANYNGKECICKECESTFKTEYGDHRSLFCSKECSKKSQNRVNRAKERGTRRGVLAKCIDPIKILDRDGWVCQICGVDTPRNLRGTHENNAPEVDHIIPLARGGPHVEGNVQCACRACNSAKGASLPIAA